MKGRGSDAPALLFVATAGFWRLLGRVKLSRQGHIRGIVGAKKTPIRAQVVVGWSQFACHFGDSCPDLP